MLVSHQRSNKHKTNSVRKCAYEGVLQVATAFKNRIGSFQFPAQYQTVDYAKFLDNIKPNVFGVIEDYILQHKTLKINFEMFGNYYLKTSGEFSIKSFNTKYEVVTVSTDLAQLYKTFEEILITKTQDFNENKSGN